MKNGEITIDGEKLRAEIMSLSSFTFLRFSTRIDIITSFDVQVRKFKEISDYLIVPSAQSTGEQKQTKI